MNLPKPRIKATKKIGDTLVHKLAWGAEGGGEWLEDDWFATMSEDLTPETTNVTCNTRKSRDKRERRHTVGVFIGAFPCGVIVIGKTGAKSHKTFVRKGISLIAQDLLKNYTQKTGFQRDFFKVFSKTVADLQWSHFNDLKVCKKLDHFPHVSYFCEYSDPHCLIIYACTHYKA